MADDVVVIAGPVVISGDDGAGDSKVPSVKDDATTPADKRLLVEADIKPGASVITVPQAVPSDVSLITRDFCRNGSSEDLLVDASPGSPDIFTFDADPTDDIILSELRMVITSDELKFDGQSFAKNSSLSNGVLIEVISDGNTVQLANLKLNEDFLSFPSVGGITVELGGSKDLLAAGYNLSGTVLKAGTADKVKITVRDDVEGSDANYFVCAVYGVKEV